MLPADTSFKPRTTKMVGSQAVTLCDRKDCRPMWMHRAIAKGWRNKELSNDGKGSLFAWRSETGQYHHMRSEEHTSELQSLMRNSYAVFCLKKKKSKTHHKK